MQGVVFGRARSVRLLAHSGVQRTEAKNAQDAVVMELLAGGTVVPKRYLGNEPVCASRCWDLCVRP
jgi:hypothetical protein